MLHDKQVCGIWAHYNYLHVHISINYTKHVRPSQVNSSLLVNILAENLPSLQQKKDEGQKKKRTHIFCSKMWYWPYMYKKHFVVLRSNITRPIKTCHWQRDMFLSHRQETRVKHGIADTCIAPYSTPRVGSPVPVQAEHILASKKLLAK